MSNHNSLSQRLLPTPATTSTSMNMPKEQALTTVQGMTESEFIGVWRRAGSVNR